ncbi:MAG: hypothetical protein LBC02_07975, partial [Planctomycetaceae bacterium]|nr:hypothetical protein [Planctomycetaceae bacterium]
KRPSSAIKIGKKQKRSNRKKKKIRPKFSKKIKMKKNNAIIPIIRGAHLRLCVKKSTFNHKVHKDHTKDTRNKNKTKF